MAITLEELQIIFKAEMGNVQEQIGGIQSQLSGFEKSAVKSQKTLGLFGKAAIVAGVVKAGKAMAGMGKEALLMANDVVESEELFEVSLGKMADKATAWSDELGNALGLNPYALRKNAGIMNVMLGSMGMSEEAAYDMSTSLTQLSEDMASFYNLSSEDMFQKIQSGMTGMAMPLKQMGILVDEETIKQYAMANGISKTGKEMTQQQKVMARYGTIMEQTRKAQGDLARTLDSPTNQLRILNNQFDQAKIALGQALQPALIAVLPHVTRFATGLAGLMTGNTDPMAGTMISLANATTAIQSRINLSIADIVADVKQGQADTEAAIDEYIAAVQRTRQLYLNLTMKPQNSVYERIPGIFKRLEQVVHSEAVKGITDTVMAQIDIILADGVASPEEIEGLLGLIKELADAEIEKKKLELKEKQAQIKLDLKAGTITPEQAAQFDVDAQTQFDTDVGIIEGIVADATAELGISNWTAKTMSKEDRDLMAAAIQKQIDAGEAAAVTAQATVSALFGSSSLSGAVDQYLDNGLNRLKTLGEEITELLNAGVEGAEIDWQVVFAKQAEFDEVMEILAGGLTPKGKVRDRIRSLKSGDADAIISFAEGYSETIDLVAGSNAEVLQRQREWLLSANEKMLQDVGIESRDAALDVVEAEIAANQQRAADQLVGDATSALAPVVQRMLKDSTPQDYDKIILMESAIATLVRSIDVSNLSESGQVQYDALVELQTQLQELGEWASIAFQNPEIKNPFAPPQANPRQPTTIPEIIIDKPRVELKDPGYVSSKGWMSPGSMPPQSVNVEVTPNPVTLYLDGYVVAQSTVTYTPKVVRTTGSVGSPKLPMLELK